MITDIKHHKHTVGPMDVHRWGLPVSLIHDAICGRPVLITRVSKSRVYYQDTSKHFSDDFETFTFKADDYEQYMNANSLLYICDTIEEAQEIYQLSQDQVKEIRESRQEVIDRYKLQLSMKRPANRP